MSIVKAKVTGPESHLERVQMELSVLRVRAAGQAVRMGGFVFNSYQELKLFVEEQVP